MPTGVLGDYLTGLLASSSTSADMTQRQLRVDSRKSVNLPCCLYDAYISAGLRHFTKNSNVARVASN